MYKSIKGLAISLTLVLTITISMTAQTIEGGGGNIALSAGADPNNITSIATQDWTKGEAIYAIDPHTPKVWMYDDSQSAGSKWVEVSSAGINDLANGIDVSLNVSNDIEVDLDIDELPAESTVDAATDYIAVYDASAGTEVKVLATNFSGGGGTVTGVNDLVNGIDLSLNGTDIEADIDIDELTTASAIDDATDYLIMYDDSETDEKKVLVDDMKTTQWREYTTGDKTNDNSTGTYHSGNVTIGGGFANSTSTATILNSTLPRTLTTIATGTTAANWFLQEAQNNKAITHSLKNTAAQWDLQTKATTGDFAITDVLSSIEVIKSAPSTGSVIFPEYRSNSGLIHTGIVASIAAFDDTTGKIIQTQYRDRLTYYVDDAAATTGGVVVEEEYKLDIGNPYGQPKGTIRVRQ